LPLFMIAVLLSRGQLPASAEALPPGRIATATSLTSCPSFSVTVAMAGDLLHGRTARSLCYLLAKYPGVSIRLIAPPAVQMKDDLLAYLRRHKVPVAATEDLAAGVRGADVLYVTRIQKERFGANTAAYEQVRNAFSVTPDVLALLPQHAIVMHPLPRVEGPHSELPTSVDTDPRVVIFDQTEAGMYVRMALLKLACTTDGRSRGWGAR